MAAQKLKKYSWGDFLSFFECLLTQNPLIKILNSLDSFRPYGRLLENPKTRD